MVYAQYLCMSKGRASAARITRRANLQVVKQRLYEREEKTRLNIFSNFKIFMYPAFSDINCMDRLVQSNHDSTDAEQK